MVSHLELAGIVGIVVCQVVGGGGRGGIKPSTKCLGEFGESSTTGNSARVCGFVVELLDRLGDLDLSMKAVRPYQVEVLENVTA